VKLNYLSPTLKKVALKVIVLLFTCLTAKLTWHPPDGQLYEKSVNSFANELIRCSKLGIEYLIIDLGSDRGYGKENGIRQLVKSCERAVYTFKSAYKKKLDVTILLQNGGGFINSMGCTIEDLREILDRLPK
jgi:deoxyribonuclease-4